MSVLNFANSNQRGNPKPLSGIDQVTPDCPLVSVVIPAYNRVETIRMSVDSVLQQTYRPIEVIVVDDGSTDGTSEVLCDYGEKILVVRRMNGGPSAARNSGVAVSTGEIVAFLDSDDTWEPAKLERQVRLMALGGENVVCCVCNARNIVGGIPSQTSFEIAGIDCGFAEGFWLNPAELIGTRFVLFNQVVAIRKEAFDRIGGFKEHMRLLEDHDLAFRLSLLGPWAFVRDPLVSKFDLADGIGVTARLDPLAHATAWANTLKGFLEEPLAGKAVRHRIVVALREVEIEITAVRMGLKGGAVRGFLSKSMMLGLRYMGAIRRRSPAWPKAKAVVALAP